MWTPANYNLRFHVFLSKSPNRETYFSSQSLEYFKKSRQLYVGMSILNARNIAFLCTASHPRSNSSLSGVPIAPKSSVIKSSIGVHPLIFIFSFVIIICSPFIIFLSKIFIHDSQCSFYFSNRCLLSFLSSSTRISKRPFVFAIAFRYFTGTCSNVMIYINIW
mgnify:CR=1 FL=1